MFIEDFVSRQYAGFTEVSMSNLRRHLETFVTLGVTDFYAQMWAIKEIDWDVEHMLHRVDFLGA